MIDAETWKIVAVNEAAIAQYGYAREEFLGRSVLDVRPPDGQAEARRILSEMPHGTWKATAVPHQRRDGSVFRVDVWSRDAVVDGRRVRISTISDVTERVHLQHELQQAQKMEAVGRLAGGIAHDFNNLLTAIIGAADFLDHHIPGNAEAAADVNEIRRAAARAASLTRQLLAFSRRQLMQVEVVPLDEVVAGAERLLRRVIGEHIELQTRRDPATWPVRVDRSQLEQVILNLAVNARDAMPSSGTLELATRNVSLAADTTADGVTIPAGDYAELAVRDTGVGMDHITRARAFEPFFTTKPAPEGTGLGLSTAYGIVRQSGGFISVESAEGRGATFRILLPRANEAGPVSLPAPPAVAPTARRTVFVVEDEDVVRRITCRVLERLGYHVLSAPDGEAALAMIDPVQTPIDLLVTDLVMPRLNGREVAAKFADAYPGLRVLFVSGYTDEAVGHLGTLDEGVAFLQKPFSIETLGDAVRRSLGER